jgi:hypothetical protein
VNAAVQSCAVDVQTDMFNIMAATSAAGRARASAALRRDERTLDAERARIYSIVRSAERALTDHAALPSLPG